MTRPFKQSDVERLFRAAKAAGVTIAVKVERATGDLVAVPVDPASRPAANLGPTIEGDWGDYAGEA